MNAITLDIDWAPDFVIDAISSMLIEAEVKATWFVTHSSPAVSRLQKHSELFELGIHPNFLTGSTHGATPEAILQHCMQLVPGARSMRTHGLVQSSPLLATLLQQTPITTDVSLFLPYAEGLRPFEYWCRGRSLLRIPFYWEDDAEMERPHPVWEVTERSGKQDGLRVFNFHPIHVFLNSSNMTNYEHLKRSCPKLQYASQKTVERFASAGAGTRVLFRQLVDVIAAGQKSCCISDLATDWYACQKSANQAA